VAFPPPLDNAAAHYTNFLKTPAMNIKNTAIYFLPAFSATQCETKPRHASASALQVEQIREKSPEDYESLKTNIKQVIQDHNLECDMHQFLAERHIHKPTTPKL